MKINKYKKRANGKYSVYLDDGRELSLYEDVILKYDLLIRKDIEDKLIEEAYHDDLEYDVYYVALNSIKSRMKSVWELTQFLKNKNYPDNFIDKAISKLIEQGYLNDRLFTKTFINNKIVTSSYGPLRIKKDLLNKKIDENIILEELVVFTEDIQKEKINKKINLSIKSNRTRGGNVLKQKIVNDLVDDGYDTSIIMSVIDDYEFGNDSNLAKKEYDKLYKRYSKKYSGYELERIIKSKLYQKGLVYEE